MCSSVSPVRSSAMSKTGSVSRSKANVDGSAQAFDRSLDELCPGTDREHRRACVRLRLHIYEIITAMEKRPDQEAGVRFGERQTAGGYVVEEVVSALQKSVRR